MKRKKNQFDSPDSSIKSRSFTNPPILKIDLKYFSPSPEPKSSLRKNSSTFLGTPEFTSILRPISVETATPPINKNWTTLNNVNYSNLYEEIPKASTNPPNFSLMLMTNNSLMQPTNNSIIQPTNYSVRQPTNDSMAQQFNSPVSQLNLSEDFLYTKKDYEILLKKIDRILEEEEYENESIDFFDIDKETNEVQLKYLNSLINKIKKTSETIQNDPKKSISLLQKVTKTSNSNFKDEDDEDLSSDSAALEKRCSRLNQYIDENHIEFVYDQNAIQKVNNVRYDMGKSYLSLQNSSITEIDQLSLQEEEQSNTSDLIQKSNKLFKKEETFRNSSQQIYEGDKTYSNTSFKRDDSIQNTLAKVKTIQKSNEPLKKVEKILNSNEKLNKEGKTKSKSPSRNDYSIQKSNKPFEKNDLIQISNKSLKKEEVIQNSNKPLKKEDPIPKSRKQHIKEDKTKSSSPLRKDYSIQKSNKPLKNTINQKSCRSLKKVNKIRKSNKSPTYENIKYGSKYSSQSNRTVNRSDCYVRIATRQDLSSPIQKVNVVQSSQGFFRKKSVENSPLRMKNVCVSCQLEDDSM